jgi:hypothetical protein
MPSAPSEYTLLFASTAMEALVVLLVGFEVIVGEIRHRAARQPRDNPMTATLPEPGVLLPRRIGLGLGLFIIIASGMLWGVIYLTYRAASPSLPERQSASEPSQGYTQAQLDDAVKKAKQNQFDQDKKGAEQQSAEAVAKGTASLRAQVAQLQSDTPVGVDKLPTSLRLYFKGDSIEQIEAKNVFPAGVIGWRERKGMLTSSSLPGWTIIMIFKKPIAYKEICFDAHESNISPPASTKDPHYAIVEFEAGVLYGLSDLYAANECKK